MIEDAISARLGELDGRLARWGLEAVQVSEPAEIKAMMAGVGKRSVHPVSEIEPGQIENGAAFWLALKRDGVFVACISARFANLTGERFERYWRELCASKYPSRECPVASVSPGVQDALHGKLVYFGGVQVAEAEQGNISKLSALVEYAKLLSLSLWRFDRLYTIINLEHRPLARVYKFGQIIDNAVQWVSPIPEGLANNQVFLVEDRETFEGRLALQPS